MTAAALTPSIEYLENGSTLSFAVPFRFIAAAHLEVTRISASGVATTLIQGTHWSATGGSTDAGGTLTLVGSTAGARLRIRRVTPRAQTTDYTATDDFPAESHETALDKMTLIAQEQDVEITDLAERAILAPDGQSGVAIDLADLADGDLLEYRGGQLQRLDPAPFAGKFYAGDAGGRVVPATGTGGGDTALRTDLAAATGSSLIGFKRSEAGAVARALTAALAGRDVDLADFGVASGVADNAPLIAAGIAGVGAGRLYWLPAVDVPMTSALSVLTNVRITGHAHGPAGGTTLRLSGAAGIRLKYDAGVSDAFATSLSHLKFNRTGKRTAAGTASYNAAARTLSILSGTVAPAVGDVLKLQGAGPSMVLPGRTGAMLAGGSTVTITSVGGNPGVEPGMHVSIPGAGPAGATLNTRVNTVSSGAFTTTDAAASPVSGVQITATWPLFARVVSGAGLTWVLDAGDQAQNVTGGALSYYDPAIDVERTCDLNYLAFSGDQHLNIYMRADASYDSNANTSRLNEILFGGDSSSRTTGLITQGWDANACVLYKPDFSFVGIGWFEDSLIGNKAYAPHFAFNTGFVCPRANNYTALMGGYVEQGTAMLGNGSGNQASAVDFLPKGTGFAGFFPVGAGLETGPLWADYVQISEAIYGPGAVKLLDPTLGAAIANLTVTATAGALPTANGSVTIADAAAPTNAELLEYCRENQAKIEAILATMRLKRPSIAS